MSVARKKAIKPPTFLGDLIELGKPGIVRMCVIMIVGGMMLSPEPVGIGTAIAAVVGGALSVASANAFNMVWERVPDQFMERTQNRPIAAGRLSTKTGLVFAIALIPLSLAILWVGTNTVTVALAAFAIASYVCIYTPLKYKTPLALVIGAVPGAVPPLLGWTAATGSIDAPGLVLAAILLFWQMPHFLAICVRRREEYSRAKILCVPVVRGDEAAKWQSVAWAAGLIPLSVMLTPLEVTGTFYAVCALLLSCVYLGFTISNIEDTTMNKKWAGGLFFASLVYLPALTLAVMIDVVLF